MKRYRVWTILLIAAVTACATQMQTAGTGLPLPSDAAAIRATLDTTTAARTPAGWRMVHDHSS